MKKFSLSWNIMIAFVHFGSCFGMVYGGLMIITPVPELKEPVIGLMILLICAGIQALVQLDAYRENWRNPVIAPIPFVHTMKRK